MPIRASRIQLHWAVIVAVSSTQGNHLVATAAQIYFHPIDAAILIYMIILGRNIGLHLPVAVQISHQDIIIQFHGWVGRQGNMRPGNPAPGVLEKLSITVGQKNFLHAVVIPILHANSIF